MTVQHDEKLVTAAQAVHNKVWTGHWKAGELTLSPNKVIDYIREVRVAANVSEQRLPEELQKLVRNTRNAEKGSTISLADLLIPLTMIIHPPAK